MFILSPLKEKESKNMSDAYSVKTLVTPIIRYTLPYVIFFITQLTVVYLIPHKQIGLLNIISLFTQGGIGLGSYYYPILIQIVFLFPLIYFTVKKYRMKGFIICAIANAVFELLQWGYGMNSGFYRLVIFRYILVIAYGCYIATADYKPNIPLCIMSVVIGGLFITATRYWNYTPTVIRYWVSTCFIASLFILLPTMLMIKKLHFGFAPLEIIGKASYHIFICQMFYFNDPSRIYNAIENRWLEMLISILICLAGGIAFYYAEMPLSNIVKKLTGKLLATKYFFKEV